MLTAEIAAYIASLGIGTFSDTGGDIFLAGLPDTPDECIYIRSTGGPQSYSGLPFDNPTVQIIVRGENLTATEGKAQAIYNALHGYTGRLTEDGRWIVSCLGMQSAPADIGKDQNGRIEYSLNFELKVNNNNRRT